MKICTSYFGALRKLPPDFVPVAICGRMVFPWSGLRYTKLAPKLKFFSEWKRNHDNDFYTRHYNNEVLSCLDRGEVLNDLWNITNNGNEDRTVVLTCYEKPKDFCHRHIVASWLSECLPYEIEEYEV